LETERCAILLDAWDEVSVEIPNENQSIKFEPGYRQWLGQRLVEFVRLFPRPRLLLTSRIVGFTNIPIDGIQELELLAFDLKQQERFVHAWFGEEKSKNSNDDTRLGASLLQVMREKHQVGGLARIPLFLALMCRAYESNQLQFPARQ